MQSLNVPQVANRTVALDNKMTTVTIAIREYSFWDRKDHYEI